MNIKRGILIIILVLGLLVNQQKISSRQSIEHIQLINEKLPPTLALTSIALGPLKTAPAALALSVLALLHATGRLHNK